MGALLLVGCDGPAPRDARPARASRQASEPEPAAPPPEAAVVTAATRPAPSPGEPSPADRSRYLAALDEGRRLHRAGDYAGAMQALGRALDLIPGDPRALSELGWAALFAGRMAEAESALRKAEAAAADDTDLLASILYNQGRVAEAQGHAPEAVALYQRSLWLRPHPATYRHLMAQPGGTRYVFGPMVRSLQGPYARIAELCAEERRLTAEERQDEPEQDLACIPDAALGLGGEAVEIPSRADLVAPWTELRFVETRPSPYAVHFHAALRTADGWFVVPDVASLSRDAPGISERATRLAARSEDVLPGDPPEVVLEVETRWEDAEGEAETHRVELLCGIGPSGVPSCTGALPRSTEVRRRGVEPVLWSLERQTTPSGTLVLRGDAARLDEPAAALLGEHPLAFP